jgi:D-aminoacyl-tRNA deacylase
MRVVLQRVSKASVTVNNEITGQIGKGLLLLLGVGREDTLSDISYLVEKILSLRIFEDADQRMNLSLMDMGGECLIVSQFTLFGDTRRGRRPSFSDAAPPETARALYERFVEEMRKRVTVATGSFGAMMQVELTNDGPVTLILDTRTSLANPSAL